LDDLLEVPVNRFEIPAVGKWKMKLPADAGTVSDVVKE
jgi:hypothetical protein